MILVDTNVFMYAAGRPHPHRDASVALLEAIARSEVDAVIDAEVLQEILHRYRAAGRWEDGRRVYDLVRRVVPDVLDIGDATLDRARALLDRYPALLARDAVHAAAVIEIAAEALCTWDQDFDTVREISTVTPAAALRG